MGLRSIVVYYCDVGGTHLQPLVNRIVDTLFPKRCVHCGRWGALVCPLCMDSIDYLYEQYCPGCKDSSVLGYTNHGCGRRSYLDQVVSIAWYRGVIRSVITQYKYEPYVTSLIDVLQDLVFRGITDTEVSLWRDVVIVPVPLHPSRQRERGFNQSEEIANLVSERIGRPVCSNLLTRIARTDIQSTIATIARRRKNMVKAFAINPHVEHDSDGKHILLIDDVYTSGSTLQSCARALKKEFRNIQISAFTIARG